MITVTYMSGGVHIHGGGYDIRLRNVFAVWFIISTAGLPVSVEYTNESIGAVAD